MAIEWLRAPVDKVTWQPGEQWSYRLPIRVRESVPPVEWACDLLPPSALVGDAGDPLRATVHVPRDARSGFGELKYRIQDDDGPVCGRILIRILGSMSGARSPGDTGVPGGTEAKTHLLPSNPPVRPPGAGVASPKYAVAVASASVEQVTPGSAEQPVSTGASPVDSTPVATGPVLQGRFHVAVIRHGVLVPHLKTAIHPARTTTIGRSSSSHGLPDLDLRGQFETPEMEAACSRCQAEVFWSEQRIWIKTLGKNPLKFVGPDDQPGENVPESYCWQPDHVLILPGKLRLALRRERSG